MVRSTLPLDRLRERFEHVDPIERTLQPRLEPGDEQAQMILLDLCSLSLLAQHSPTASASASVVEPFSLPLKADVIDITCGSGSGARRCPVDHTLGTDADEICLPERS